MLRAYRAARAMSNSGITGHVVRGSTEASMLLRLRQGASDGVPNQWKLHASHVGRARNEMMLHIIMLHGITGVITGHWVSELI